MPTNDDELEAKVREWLGCDAANRDSPLSRPFQARVFESWLALRLRLAAAGDVTGNALVEIARQRDEISALRSELESARKDSERLDKLERIFKHAGDAIYCDLLNQIESEGARAAIDAAQETNA